MDGLPASALIAQMVGLTSSAFVSGAIITISVVCVPPLLQSSASTLTQQWRTLFWRGASRLPFLAAISCFTSGYAAYARYKAAAASHRGDDSSWLYPVATAALTVAIVPFTVLAMSKTNNKLLRLASLKAQEPGASAEAFKLVEFWSTLNLTRGLLPLAGSVVGLWGLGLSL